MCIYIFLHQFLLEKCYMNARLNRKCNKTAKDTRNHCGGSITHGIKPVENAVVKIFTQWFPLNTMHGVAMFLVSMWIHDQICKTDAMRKPILIFGKNHGSAEHMLVCQHFYQWLIYVEWNICLKKGTCFYNTTKFLTFIVNIDKHKLLLHT